MINNNELKNAEEKLYISYNFLIKLPIALLLSGSLVTLALVSNFGILFSILVSLVPSLIITGISILILNKVVSSNVEKIQKLRNTNTQNQDNNENKYKKIEASTSKKMTNKEKIDFLNQAKVNLKYDNNKHKKKLGRQFQKIINK